MMNTLSSYAIIYIDYVGNSMLLSKRSESNITMHSIEDDATWPCKKKTKTIGHHFILYKLRWWILWLNRDMMIVIIKRQWTRRRILYTYRSKKYANILDEQRKSMNENHSGLFSLNLMTSEFRVYWHNQLNIRRFSNE
jgi:hypothetical protein